MALLWVRKPSIREEIDIPSESLHKANVDVPCPRLTVVSV
ncbi:hypothetical protein IC006_1043 [Sulfuracidifex tepidarius]|uniref:Uncharacterized protein n=1 Tax=Sulfuracidifex tepidarius TaxID=1294262 RepID=A0A510DUM3_9CREN|nr:hypothetical protein IC006_1043 [Sulfuracidifex tepidarius]BBG26503.1 hypothetical protein IC007_1016 [Sulfuracidifex tepidarius]